MNASNTRTDTPGNAESQSAGLVETQYYDFAEPPNELVLDSGRTLGPVRLAYETYGALNPERTNAVLITHALSGDAHAAGKHSPDDRKPGWWDSMIGPGKAFDTNRYFVLCSNVLGGCMGSTGPSSINPETGRPYGLDFPFITIGDMVRAQYHLVTEGLGIEQLLCVAGGSMGGMQALEWATRYPDAVQSAIVIAASSCHSAQQIAFHAVGRHSIQADPRFKSGQYYDEPGPSEGLAIARMLGHITYLSDESMHAKFGRRLQDDEGFRFGIEDEFSVESYLDHQGVQFVHRFDANSYLYVSKALDYFDLAAPYGSLDGAMARVTGKTMVLAFSSDWLYPPYQSEQMVYALTRQHKDVTYCNVASDYGHDAFLLETEVQQELIAGFLRHVMNPERFCPKCDKAGHPTEDSPTKATQTSIYSGRRVDYDLIVDLVAPESRVLDIGCGTGELLCRLMRAKQVRGMGLEVDQDNIVSAVGCGISVVQADIDRGLEALPDQSFDYVLLSMTLQVLQRPELALREMLRVGKKCIVSFPNFAHWSVRAKALLSGRAPVTRNLPFAWYQSPNRHVLSIRDFQQFCAERAIVIEKTLPLAAEGVTHVLPNLFAEEAVFVLSQVNETQ